jgi:hypothetical protein
MLERAAHAFRDEAVPAPDALGRLPFACRMSLTTWDDESWHAFSARPIERAGQAGTLAALPDALQDGTALRLATGETAVAIATAREAGTVAAATGNPARALWGLSWSPPGEDRQQRPPG